jgi:hypothetical protein
MCYYPPIYEMYKGYDMPSKSLADRVKPKPINLSGATPKPSDHVQKLVDDLGLDHKMHYALLSWLLDNNMRIVPRDK